VRLEELLNCSDQLSLVTSLIGFYHVGFGNDRTSGLDRSLGA
jgi:hypothetical protein